MHRDPLVRDLLGECVFPRQEVGDLVVETLPIEVRDRGREDLLRSSPAEALDEEEDAIRHDPRTRSATSL